MFFQSCIDMNIKREKQIRKGEQSDIKIWRKREKQREKEHRTIGRGLTPWE